MSEQPPARRERASPSVLHERGSLTVQQVHQGPLPSPNDLARYEKVMPGLGDTIVSMATSEQAHRHKMETLAVKSFSVGPWLAFVLGMSSLAAAVILLLNGIGWPAFFLIPAGFIPSVLSSLSQKSNK